MLDESTGSESMSTPPDSIISGDIEGNNAPTFNQQETFATLIYNSGCDFCRTLALRLQALSRRPLDLLALSDPRAKRLLSKFYPSGWAHDFYLIKGTKCYRRSRSLISLTGIVGLRNVVAAVAEYARFKLSAYGHRHNHVESSAINAETESSNSTSSDSGSGAEKTVDRRRLIRYSAAAAGFTALNTLPYLNDPFTATANASEVTRKATLTAVPSIENLSAYVTRVTRKDGAYATTISECAECLHPAKEMKPNNNSGPQVSVDLQRQISNEVESPSGKNFPATLGLGEFKIQKKREFGDIHYVVNMTTQQIVLRDERYTIKFSIGRAVNNIPTSLLTDEQLQKFSDAGKDVDDSEVSFYERISMAANVIHDVPARRGDFVIYDNKAADSVERHLEGYSEASAALARSIKELSYGQSLSGVYEDVAAGFASMARWWPSIANQAPTGVMSNKLFIAPFPEYLKFMSLGDDSSHCPDESGAPGDDCCCVVDCGCCTGGACGIGCDICYFPPHAGCGFGCCAAGCSCGVSCGCCI